MKAFGPRRVERLERPSVLSCPMKRRPKLLALVLAGGEGSRLGVLTDARAKPALPFAGSYHLIDIPLSNLYHSGVSDVWIVVQYRPHALSVHLANGRPWDLDRTYGGLRLLPPFEGKRGAGFAEGNAEALFQQLTLIRDFDPDLLLVLSADHLYKLDYREVVARHLELEAELTMVTKCVPKQEASRFGVVVTNRLSRVTSFAYKPETPESGEVTAEIFVYDAKALMSALETLAEAHGSKLGDYGDTLIPELLKGGKVYAYPHQGYWRDLGTVESYWQAHMDLLEDAPEFVLDEPEWPFLTRGGFRQPARIFREALIDNSLVSPGCTVRGEVRRSVLVPGVVVEAGARVVDSVVLEDAVIEAGSEVSRAILDKDTVIGEGSSVRGTKAKLSLIGMGRRLEPGTRLRAGSSLEPAVPDVD